MLSIHRTRSRFARGELRNAIHVVQDHHDRAYADEDAQPEFCTARRPDGSFAVTCDALGVAYRVVPS